jgi:histidine triad (HIT) family protein
MSRGDCVFCGIVAGTQPSVTVRQWPEAVAFRPLNPVTEGHVLVVPRTHVADAAESPTIAALVMARAAELAGMYDAANILTSIGAAATQSVFHLHVHVVPRREADGLMLPWGTTGDPHEPHRCPGIDALTAEVKRLTAPVVSGLPAHVGQLTWHQPPTPGPRYVPVPVEGPQRVTWPRA